VGHTPVLCVPKSYEQLSVICVLTEDYRLYWHCQQRPYKGVDIASFLSGLSKKLGRKLLIVWDGAGIHFSQASKIGWGHREGRKAGWKSYQPMPLN
jgi:hypothetical protein